AIAPSFMEEGIALMAFLVAIMIIGRTINDKVKPPTKAEERGIEKKLRYTTKPKSPKIMEGIAAKLLILISIMSVMILRGANSSKYKALITPTGKAQSRNIIIVKNEPIIPAAAPALSGSLESAF